jgi:hypothetical protein
MCRGKGLGGVLAKCNEMGGSAAQGVGYGIAYVFSKGMVQVRVVVVGVEVVGVDGRGGGSLLAGTVTVSALRARFSCVTSGRQQHCTAL